MTDEEIELCKPQLGSSRNEHGFQVDGLWMYDFARAIEAKVREECAVICEGISEYKNDKHKSYEPHSKEWYAAGGASLGADDCAEAIRARGTDE